MCGICGSTRAGDGGVLRAMNARMERRGPDDEGTYIDRATGVGLGARRLKIIDLEGGHQPLANEDGTVWAVLNGEIYNYRGLREALQRRGHRLATASDTEVLVHLYEDHGSALVHALEGMFAFAIWDETTRTLVVGRDRFGEKPLFYLADDSGLTFASELTALAAGCTRTLRLDAAAVDAFFNLGYVPGPRAIVEDVRQLEPGHVLTWSDAEGVACEPYWTPPESTEVMVGDREEFARETKALLEATVASRLIADVPVGVFLSGGLDSSLVAALAQRVSGEHLATFSVGYDVGGVSELAQARAVAELIGARHHELVLTSAAIGSDAEPLLRSLDQPLADPALIALHALASFARPHVTVAVGGEGADELFGGYPRYRWLTRMSTLEPHVPSAVHSAAGAVRSRLVARPHARWSRGLRLLEHGDAMSRHNAWVGEDRGAFAPRLYGRRLRDVIADGRSYVVDPRFPDVVDEARLMRFDQVRWLPDDVLAKADRASMSASLEFRTPFLNRELAEFAAGIPASSHVINGGKAILRDVIKDALPGFDHRRSKTAFRVPISDWLAGPLAPRLRAQLDGPLFEAGWFSRDDVKVLVDEHVDGRRDWAHVLWTLFTLGAWLEGAGALYA